MRRCAAAYALFAGDVHTHIGLIAFGRLEQGWRQDRVACTGDPQSGARRSVRFGAILLPLGR